MHTRAFLKAGAQITASVLQLVQTLSNKQLDFSSLMPVVGSSVVIKVLQRSCQNISTVTDLIIDGWLLGFAD